MCEALAKGNPDEALKLLRKSVPFPEILCRICDEPCGLACLRGERGAPVRVRMLERAAVEYGRETPSRRPLIRKKQRALVAGGGLAGLTAARELGRKGYAVTLLVPEDRAGGELLVLPESILPRDVVMRAVASLPETVTVRTGAATLSPREEWDAAFLADARFLPDMKGDPLSLVTSDPVVFAPDDRTATSPVLLLSYGKRAALSMDRVFQNVSLTASREGETGAGTRLYTSLEGVTPSEAVRPSDGDRYALEEAALEAQRCIQCSCLECVKRCPFLDHYGGYPKLHIRTIYNNLAIVMGNRTASRMINSCAICGLCARVCPNDLDMGAVCLEARRSLVAMKKMPTSAHDFALRNMASSGSEEFALCRNEPGTERSAWLFFPGCQLGASDPAIVERTYSWLRSRLPRGDDAGTGLLLRCCGAIGSWAGRDDLAQAERRALLDAWERMGRPVVVTACPSCARELQAVLPADRLRTIWDVAREFGLPVEGELAGLGDVRVLDPCAARDAPETRRAVRELLRRRGLRNASEGSRNGPEPDDGSQSECCGYGGLVTFAHPALAERFACRASSGDGKKITYCAMCRDLFARSGAEAYHILDILFAREPGDLAARPCPSWSERRDRRRLLRARLLRTIWGENAAMREIHVRLLFSGEVEALTDRRWILREDIETVVTTAERTGRKFRHRTNGRFLASARIGAVTVWCEYEPEGDAFRVHRAYSHRMRIGEEEEHGVQ
jgi:Fe-S oxidoreductase